tara:strand:+ start:359 stop:802 length:444 start_codon:yes stop_codon:yes gene_type:complete
MSEANFLATLAKSKAAANRAAKGLNLSQLEKAIANLSQAVKAAKSRESLKEQKKKTITIKKLQALMISAGISPEDMGLAGAPKTKGKGKRKSATTKGKKQATVAPKYQITVDGKTSQWTGRGRTPIVFRTFVDNGGSLEQCLIPQTA